MAMYLTHSKSEFDTLRRFYTGDYTPDVPFDH
jgi:hypothetical protein